MDKVSDNVIHDFPARMSDGRFMTDYSPNCEMNMDLQKNMSSWQYRQLLTSDSDNITKMFNNYYEKLYGSGSTKSLQDNFEPRYKQTCNVHGCSIKEVNPHGFGIVQSYE